MTHLTLGADYDDGLVAYLNGVEVARLHMPAGSINHATAALDNGKPPGPGRIITPATAIPRKRNT